MPKSSTGDPSGPDDSLPLILLGLVLLAGGLSFVARHQIRALNLRRS